MDMAVASISVASPRNAAVVQQEIGDGVKKKGGETEDLVRVPTIRVPQGQHLTLVAAFRPGIDELPSAVRQRIKWTGLVLGSDGRWSAVPMGCGKGDLSACGVQISQPGTYLVLVALSPVSLSRLPGRPSSYIQSFLTSSAAPRCRAIQVLVSDQGLAKSAPPVPVAAAGVMIELRSQGGEPSLPPPAPIPSPQHPASETSENKPAEQQAGAEQPPPPKTMIHEGDDPQGTVNQDKNDSKIATAATASATPIPPIAPASAATTLVVSNATLPQTVLKYSRTEIAQLDSDTWDAICNANAMPFVAVPDDDYLSEYGGKWIVMTPDGKQTSMTPDDVEAAFGLKFLHLSALREDVLSTTRERFNDAVGWFKCGERRGFLLNNLLLEAVNAALQERKDIADVGQIKLITVSLAVNRDNGSLKLRVKVEGVDTSK